MATHLGVAGYPATAALVAITGTLSVTEADDGLSAAGITTAITGTLNVTEAPDSLKADGFVTSKAYLAFRASSTLDVKLNAGPSVGEVGSDLCYGVGQNLAGRTLSVVVRRPDGTLFGGPCGVDLAQSHYALFTTMLPRTYAVYEFVGGDLTLPGVYLATLHVVPPLDDYIEDVLFVVKGT